MASDPPDFPASQLFLRRLAYRLVREESLAEDLVQETWRAWLERAPQGLTEPRAWMARVLRNLAFNAQRANARRSARELERASPAEVEPETDGTLEAQAHLVAALRALDEPYRSMLVQRYYHDLGPKEIAERTGTPLETVRSRLARGLAKLREDLDRRYGNDRSAWCHWLWTLARPGVGVPTDVERGPAERSSSTTPSTLAAGARGSPWLLSGVLAGAGLLVGLVCVTLLDGGRREGLRAGVVPTTERGSRGELDAARSPARETGVAEEPATVAAPLAPPPPSAGAAPRTAFLFDWPQHLGRASHDPRGLARSGSIRAPKVLWLEPEARGAPTFLGGRCYVGGEALLCLDSHSGERLAELRDESCAGFVGSPVLLQGSAEGSGNAPEEAGSADQLDPDLERRLRDKARALRARGASDGELQQALLELYESRVAGAHATGTALVLARRACDGGVVACAPDLATTAWEWNAGRPRHLWPPALAGWTLLVTKNDELYGLDARTGEERWRSTTGPAKSALEMVPAADDEHAYVASEDGVVYQVNLDTGGLRKLHETGGWFFGAHPLVFSTGVLFVDRGSALMRPAVDLAPGEELWPGANDRRGEVWAFGELEWLPRLLWHVPYGGTAPSTPGLGLDGLLLGARDTVRTLAFDGTLDEERPFRTGFAPLATPVEHEGDLLVGTAEGTLELFVARTREHRWTFRLPPGERVEEFVWAGPRVFVATTLGLFCLGSDPTVSPDTRDFVLDWTPALALGLELERAQRGR